MALVLNNYCDAKPITKGLGVTICGGKYSPVGALVSKIAPAAAAAVLETRAPAGEYLPPEIMTPSPLVMAFAPLVAGKTPPRSCCYPCAYVARAYMLSMAYRMSMRLLPPVIGRAEAACSHTP